MHTTRVFTALKPTGRLQLGNYLGAIRPLLNLAEDTSNDVTVAVADLHALTVAHDPAHLRALTLEVATTLIACGLPERAHMFVQSALPAHTELSYLLESTATYGEMTRMVQFREKAAQQESVRLSLLTYPALMAADILVHQSDVVPVGEDQRQHLELTTDVAERFNSRYGTTFTVPKPVTPPNAARVKDLRDPAAKMGKSGADGAGVIYLLDSPDVIATKIRRAVTDADPALTFDPEHRPAVANLAIILGALTGQSPSDALRGLRGGAQLKDAVTGAVLDTLGPIQRAYAHLANEPALVRTRLRHGLDHCSTVANSTVANAREAMGLLTT